MATSLVWVGCLLAGMTGASPSEFSIATEAGKLEFKLEGGELWHRLEGAKDFATVDAETPIDEVVDVRVVQGQHRGGVQTLFGIALGGEGGYTHAVALRADGRLFYAFRKESGKWIGWRDISGPLNGSIGRALKSMAWLDRHIKLTVETEVGGTDLLLDENGEPSWAAAGTPVRNGPALYSYEWRLEALRLGTVVARKNFTNNALTDAQAQSFALNKCSTWADELRKAGVDYDTTRPILVSKSPQ